MRVWAGVVVATLGWGGVGIGGAGAEPVGLCFGKPASILAAGVIRGTAEADVIIGGPGRDRIVGGGGNDRICSGAGDDLISGEVGSDLVAAGAGDDEVQGGNGSDRVEAGPGRDFLRGNRGNDHLAGDSGSRDFVDAGLGDDIVEGGSGGFDQLVGGIGNDRLVGGSGRGDLLRGDRGADLYDGGSGGHDTASFAVAGLGGTVLGGKGVKVDLGIGEAEHDGPDRLLGIEDVIGTPFADVIRGNARPNDLYGGGGFDDIRGVGPDDDAHGGINLDRCLAVALAEDCELVGASPAEVPLPAEELFGARGLPAGPTLEVDLAGGPAAASLTAVVDYPGFLNGGAGIAVAVSFADQAWLLSASGIPIAAGDGCGLVTTTLARCPITGTPDAVLLGGSGGADRLEVTAEVPASVSALIGGNLGADTILGGAGDDSLNGISGDGPLPTDVLRGRAGDDALTNGLTLSGGSGSDLLIAHTCAGETVSGDAGVDSVSFARVESAGVEATIGGIAGMPPLLHGPHPFPGGCPDNPAAPPTRISDSVESIEGSPVDDVLKGNGRRNILLGRGGDDRVLGEGGDDFLVGGTGADALFGAGGADRLYARDSTRDARLSCGSGGVGDVLVADPRDPAPKSCRLLRRSP